MPNWDEYYQQKDVIDDTPVQVLKNNTHLLKTQNHNLSALDFACGLSANGRFLESLGYQVSAWDYSAVVVEKLNAYSRQHQLNFAAYQYDLENEKLPNELFDVVVVSYFLNRELSQAISRLLKPKGLLFYQTFCGERMNDQGPSNPNFRLQSAELLNLFPDLKTIYYREDGQYAAGENALPDQAMLVAVR